MSCGRCGVQGSHVVRIGRLLAALILAALLMTSAAQAGVWTEDPLTPLVGPQSQETGDGILYTDACVPATSWCMALGVDDTGGINHQTILDEVFSDGAWTQVPGPPGFARTYPVAESCSSTTYCMSVSGVWGTVAIWNGTSWSLAPSSRGIAFQTVSCHATTCVATGTRGRTLIPSAEMWRDGVAHRIAAPIAGLDPESIYCGTTSRCIAVGDYDCPEEGRCPSPRPFAESWNGRTWSVMNGAATSHNAVDKISCLSLSWCIGVGRGHADRWDGRRWTALGTRPPGGLGGGLISCASESSCEIVSSGPSPANPNASVLSAGHWDGQSWTREPVPDGNAVDSGLRALSCPLATLCTAVGAFGRAVQTPLAESWQG
jgi:hypothetical protein